MLATLLAELTAQGAKAIVFDILIADADQRNPVSERAFEDAVVKTRTAYFAVLRLSPSSDATSAVRFGGSGRVFGVWPRSKLMRRSPCVSALFS